ncbi:MAG: hypothetical protein QM740_17960 [Acidovorax sp.]
MHTTITATAVHHNSIVTTQTGSGPLMAIDLLTLPQDVALEIIQAALCVSFHYESSGLESVQEDSDADDALIRLAVATGKINQHMKPTVPGADLYGSHHQQVYPVIRDGVPSTVPLASMSPLEIQVTIQRLRTNADSAKSNIKALEDFLGNLHQAR